MRKFAVSLVKSKDATIGVECYSGPEARHDDSVYRFADAVVQACYVYGPAEILGGLRPLYATDLRGQTFRGSSLEPGAGFSLEDYNADVDAVREFLGKDKIALIGYSLGGFFSAQYALNQPERVEALVLIEPAIFNDPAELLERARLAEADGVSSADAMLRYVDPTMSEEDRAKAAPQVVEGWHSPEAMAAMYRTRAENTLSADDLARLQELPVLLIGGSESAMKFQVEKLAEALPQAQVQWVDGADHVGLMEDERFHGDVAQIVHSFLQDVEAQSAGVMTAGASEAATEATVR